MLQQIIQVYGAAMTQSDPNISEKTVLKCTFSFRWRRSGLIKRVDLHIYMGGVGVQQLFIVVFVIYAVGFQRTVVQERLLDGRTKTKLDSLLCTLYICLGLISVCITLAHSYTSLV